MSMLEYRGQGMQGNIVQPIKLNQAEAEREFRLANQRILTPVKRGKK